MLKLELQKTTTNRIGFLAIVTAFWLVSVSVLFVLAQRKFHDVWPLALTFLRWDGGWYHAIAEQGYAPGAIGAIHAQASQVFFPLYPVLIAMVQRTTHIPAIVAGVALSLAAFCLALVIFYDLVASRYDESTARWATLLLAFNPFALFFGLMYTESLFLLLSVLCFWLIQKEKWWLAAAVAGAATATRATGVFLGAIVVAQWFLAKRSTWRGDGLWIGSYVKLIAISALSLSGIALFAAYLQYHNHDALAFIQLQRYWGRTGVTNLLPELHANAVLISHHTKSYLDSILYATWCAATLIGVVGIFLLFRQSEYWFAAYVGLSLILPLTSGSLDSMNRYVMVQFPLYIAFSRALNHRVRFLVVAASILGFFLMWWLYLDPRHLFIG